MELNYDNLVTLARFADSDSALTMYALIDHGAIPELTKRLESIGVSWVSLFEGSRDEGALEVAPILVLLSQQGRLLLSQDAIDWLIDQGRYSSSLQFLFSPLEMAQLSRRLMLRLDATLPDNVDIVLRYFDGRTFESLMSVLNDQQRAQFLAASAGWFIVDRKGQMREYKAHFHAVDSEVLPLELNVDQERALLEHSEPDQVAMLLHTVVPGEFGEIKPFDRHEFVTLHIAAARKYSIDTVQGQAMYCSLVLTNGANFTETPQWQSALADVAARRLTIFEASDRITDD